MKNIISFCFLFITCFCFAQQDNTVPEAYSNGEWFKFRIHYGWFNASFATLEVREDNYKNTPVHHVVGRGESTGMLDLFFEVDDNYESYIDKSSGFPLKFVRDIDEGGHTKNLYIEFNQQDNNATVHDKKHGNINTYSTKGKVQDMLSVLYYLRNQIDPDKIEKGDEYLIDLFFDDKNYKFKTVFLKKEILKTKFGKIRALKFRPFVQAGRVFKEKESLTLWISADKNKIPLKIKADLAVGSLEADLDGFKGLKHPFMLIMD